MNRVALTFALLTACGGAPVKGEVALSGVALVSPAGEIEWLELGTDRTIAVQDCLKKVSKSSKSALKNEELFEGKYQIHFVDERGDHIWTLSNTEDLADGDTYYKTDCLYEIFPE